MAQSEAEVALPVVAFPLKARDAGALYSALRPHTPDSTVRALLYMSAPNDMGAQWCRLTTVLDAGGIFVPHAVTRVTSAGLELDESEPPVTGEMPAVDRDAMVLDSKLTLVPKTTLPDGVLKALERTRLDAMRAVWAELTDAAELMDAANPTQSKASPGAAEAPVTVGPSADGSATVSPAAGGSATASSATVGPAASGRTSARPIPRSSVSSTARMHMDGSEADGRARPTGLEICIDRNGKGRIEFFFDPAVPPEDSGAKHHVWHCAPELDELKEQLEPETWWERFTEDVHTWMRRAWSRDS